MDNLILCFLQLESSLEKGLIIIRIHNLLVLNKKL